MHPRLGIYCSNTVAVPYIPQTHVTNSSDQTDNYQYHNSLASMVTSECLDVMASPSPPSDVNGGVDIPQEEVINQVASRLRLMGDQLDQEHGQYRNPERMENRFWQALDNSLGFLVELVNIIYLEPHQRYHHRSLPVNRPRPPPRRRRDTI